MSLLTEIQKIIEQRNMLQHPFYRDWRQGVLSKAQLQNYAAQYMPFVEAFPRFVSATHSQCESQQARKLLLENLMDEEGERHSPPHPELWRDFAEGIGTDLLSAPDYGEKAEKLKETFMELSRSSFEEGLCALYAYEYQIPEIAKAKIEGLAQHYGITDEKTLHFFSVHEKADVYHSQACAQLIAELDLEKDINGQPTSMRALAATTRATDALWNFLTEVHH